MGVPKVCLWSPILVQCKSRPDWNGSKVLTTGRRVWVVAPHCMVKVAGIGLNRQLLRSFKESCVSNMFDICLQRFDLILPFTSNAVIGLSPVFSVQVFNNIVSDGRNTPEPGNNRQRDRTAGGTAGGGGTGQRPNLHVHMPRTSITFQNVGNQPIALMEWVIPSV